MCSAKSGRYWFAVALFAGAVVALVNLKDKWRFDFVVGRSRQASVDTDLGAKLASVTDARAENVIIFRPPVHQQSGRALRNFFQHVIANLQSSGVNDGFWPHERFALVSGVSQVGEIKVFGYRTFEKHPIFSRDHELSWSRSRVFPNDVEIPTVYHATNSVNRTGVHVFQENESLLSGIESPFGYFSRFLCGFGGLPCDGNGILHVAGLSKSGCAQHFELPFPSLPKVDGGEPQADGGDAQHNREGRHHGLVVVIALDPLKPSFAKQKRPSKEGGAVILIIVGGLFVVLWLYQAKR
jgi:hypothetical protein